MGNYEKQGKQKAAYPIPISLPPMPQQFYKDIGRDEVCQPLWFSVGTTHIKSVYNTGYLTHIISLTGIRTWLQCFLLEQPNGYLLQQWN